MTDYSELVKALREYSGCRKGEIARITSDAADAIEELQADQKKTVTQIFGEEQMAWEGRCKALMYQIADLQAQLPKQGEWLNVTDSYSWYGKCSVCGEEFVVDAYYAGGMNYCPNCGSQMRGEVNERD